MVAAGLPTSKPSAFQQVSARELEVLELVAQGLRNVDIAERLVISEKTVKSHLQHIYEKLGVRSRTEAAARARERGLFD
jgi:DNA-binding NarL/FixJ family response regulator